MTGGIMAGLAAVLLTAGACVQEGARPTATLVALDSADQVLFKMSTTVTGDGVKRSVVVAETAYVYQARQEYDMRLLSITFFDPQGAETSMVTARSGTYDVQNGSFNAFGAVQWMSADRTKILRSERLRYDKAANEISSDTAFVYQSGADILRGNAFKSDTEMRNVITQRPRGRQGPIALPGQR